jgi:polyisoprenoid-binding protein YceI
MARRLALVCLMLLPIALGQRTFVLSDGSEARFYIDEILLGNEKTVVGTTSRVTGEVVFDLTNPPAATLSVITIDARDLTTDDSRRNNQIQTRILRSSQEAYRYITFAAHTIGGLPERAQVGDTFTLEITGDLTIAGTTRAVTFTVDVTVVTEDELQGVGTAIVRHADFNLTIPRVPLVARVDDEVRLELVFVAKAP